MLSIFQAQSLVGVLLYARNSNSIRISHVCFSIYRMSETRRPILRRVFVYSFSHDYFRNSTMLLERKREREQERDRKGRWKELSTVLKISLRRTGCLSKGNVCAGVMQISPNVCRRTAWQRQIIRGARRCISFMQIFMKFSWSRSDTPRKVWARYRVRLVFEASKYTNPMQFKRLHAIANAIWSIFENAICLCHRVYRYCAYIQARIYRYEIST